MAGFAAGGVVDPLDYDFSPYVSARGVIPEPTDTQITEFLRGIKTIFKDAEKELPSDLDVNDPAAVLKAIDDLDPGKQIEALGKMAEVYAQLCSGTPDASQISALPLRVRQVFFAWIQGEVMAPEAVTGAGRAQVTPLHSARAG